MQKLLYLIMNTSRGRYFCTIYHFFQQPHQNLSYIWGLPSYEAEPTSRRQFKVMTKGSWVSENTFWQVLKAQAASFICSQGQQLYVRCLAYLIVLAVQNLVSVPKIMFLDTELLSLPLQPSKSHILFITFFGYTIL